MGSIQEMDFEGVKAGLPQLHLVSSSHTSSPELPWVLIVWAGLAIRRPMRRYGPMVLQAEPGDVTSLLTNILVCMCAGAGMCVCTCVCRRLRSTQMSLRLLSTLFIYFEVKSLTGT